MRATGPEITKHQTTMIAPRPTPPPTLTDVDAHQLQLALEIVQSFMARAGLGVHIDGWVGDGTTELSIRAAIRGPRYTNGACEDRSWPEGKQPRLSAQDLRDMEQEAWEAACANLALKEATT
jgi:hypothetical protein